MLRVTSIKGAANAEAYYAHADYYLDAQRCQPGWHGKAAGMLMLAGELDREHFGRLLRNQMPFGKGKVTASQRGDRRAVFDFTFSVPKSVTLLHSLAGDERIEDAFRQSVLATMKLIEAEAKVRVRVKKESRDRVSGNLVYADFLHHYSRPVDGQIDPQLHMHVAVLNMSFDPIEKKWKALQAGDLKADAPYFQAVFRQELADRLQGLGYELNVSRGDFEVVGVPKTAIKEFSKRTELINARAKEFGINHAEAKAKLGAQTREGKPTKLTKEELWYQWRTRISEADYTAIDYSHRVSLGRTTRPERNDAHFVDLAMSHLTERRSVVSERRVITDAMSRGLGQVSLEGIQQDIRRRVRKGGFLAKLHDGKNHLTTRQIMLEEIELVDLWKRGRGKRRRIRRDRYEVEQGELSRSQKSVVNHILDSRDNVISVRGIAGTGKTRTMLTAKKAIEENGLSVVALAPTGDASRNTMRSEGMDDANTLHAFTNSLHLQKKARHGVIFVDEASLAGVTDMLALTRQAKELDARLVLWGDRKQHKSVPRGDVLSLLEDFAGIKCVELSDIRRQRGTYKKVVEELARGRTEKAFDLLDDLGWIKEAGHDQLAKDYLQLIDAGKSVTVVAPTHNEGRSVTAHIREQLRQAELIGKGWEFGTLRDLQWTETERRSLLAPGHVVQFNRHSGPFRIGNRLQVTEATVEELRNRASAFSAYEPTTTELAPGDKIRATRGGYTTDRKHRLENGSFYTIKNISDDGEVTLTNGWKIGKDFGHLTHGYVTTSLAAQGRTADHVLIAQSAESYPASNKKQVYVSVSRGRNDARIYCDDRDSLRRTIQKSNAELTGHQLFRLNGRKPSRLKLALANAIRLVRASKMRKLEREVSRLSTLERVW